MLTSDCDSQNVTFRREICRRKEPIFRLEWERLRIWLGSGDRGESWERTSDEMWVDQEAKGNSGRGKRVGWVIYRHQPTTSRPYNTNSPLRRKHQTSLQNFMYAKERERKHSTHAATCTTKLQHNDIDSYIQSESHVSVRPKCKCILFSAGWKWFNIFSSDITAPRPDCSVLCFVLFGFGFSSETLHFLFDTWSQN